MTNNQTLARRLFVLIYGVGCYWVFFGTFLYALGFVGNFVVPKSMDSPANASPGSSLLVNLALLGVFAVQHSLMARPWFKQMLTRIIPPAAERSTYVLLSSLALLLLFWKWEPLGGVIWNVEGSLGRGLLHGGFAFGWLLVLVTTFLINHFDLFGLRQVWLFFRREPYVALRFGTPGPYKLVRHPLYVGWFCAFWFTPTMTVTHLVFAIATSLYILIAIRLEERDLVAVHGKEYVQYRERVPMLIPNLASRSERSEEATVPASRG